MRRSAVGGVLLAVLLVGAAVMVLASPHSQRFTAAVSPDQFQEALDPALIGQYPPILGVAHNAGNRLDTLSVALDNGAAVIEVDVVSTRGRLVAGRDQRLAWIANRLFRGPTLEQVWNAAESAQILKLDLKQDDQAYLDDLVAFLAPREGTRRVMISTRDADALRFLRGQLADVELLTSLANPEAIATFRSDGALRAEVDGVSVFQGLVDGPLVTWLHEERLLVLTWTVNDVVRLNQVVSAGVDGVTTANLAILQELAPAIPSSPAKDPT
ncbi:MAG: glycerophosphodiester phosphodiesterase [Candidatus Nanopelagicales bacterium]